VSAGGEVVEVRDGLGGEVPHIYAYWFACRLFIPTQPFTKELNEAFRRVAVSPRHRVVPPTGSLGRRFDPYLSAEWQLYRPIVYPGNSGKNEG
jgi:hypothetical protein